MVRIDRYIKAALGGALSKLATFVTENFVALFLGLCLLALLVIAGYWSWEFWGEATYRDGKLVELKVDRGRIIQQLLILFGGLLALILAMWRTWTAKLQADASLQQVTIAQRGQNTERYVKAVEMLSSDSASQRRSALLALKEIATLDLPASYVSARHTLLTFIEETSNQYWMATDTFVKNQRANDVSDAFVIFGQLKASYDPQDKYVLSLANFPFIEINQRAGRLRSGTTPGGIGHACRCSRP
jgi:hypothetical protein